MALLSIFLVFLQKKQDLSVFPTSLPYLRVLSSSNIITLFSIFVNMKGGIICAIFIVYVDRL